MVLNLIVSNKLQLMITVKLDTGYYITVVCDGNFYVVKSNDLKPSVEDKNCRAFSVKFGKKIARNFETKNVFDF